MQYLQLIGMLITLQHAKCLFQFREIQFEAFQIQITKYFLVVS